jgi:hypothetical protein
MEAVGRAAGCVAYMMPRGHRWWWLMQDLQLACILSKTEWLATGRSADAVHDILRNRTTLSPTDAGARMTKAHAIHFPMSTLQL